VHFESTLKIAQGISGFDHWAKSGDHIFLRNLDARRHIALIPGLYRYVQDSDSAKDNAEYTDRLVKVLTEELSISEYRRFGHRRIYLSAVEMSFEELTEVMAHKLFQTGPLGKALPSTVTDLMYRLNLAEDDWRFTLLAGPLRKDEVLKNIQLDLENHFNPATTPDDLKDLEQSCPEVSIVLDIDMFTTVFPARDIDLAAMNEHTQGRVKKIATELLQHVLE
jgi:hypothetical protein